MAAADVRDMLDLPAEGQQRPHKKQKVVEKRPEGITRELFALLGERAPPIAINENRYKGRPKRLDRRPVRSWRMIPFTNGARSDGLILRHWKVQPEKSGEESQTNAEHEALKPVEEEYPFVKYNVKARVPNRYTTEEYDRHLQSKDWSREETDYLMGLVEDYDLRWVLIADRYDFEPKPIETTEDPSTALVPHKEPRTMEQLKARYYFVAATMLALEHPPSEMSEAEFDLHEKMMKFDAKREANRKELAGLQLDRTADEVREESILLEELKRITANEQEFVTDRRELYSRLDVPISVGNATNYHNSQGLSHLLQTLLQADKSKKRRSLLGPEGIISTPGGQTPITNAPGSARESSRADTPNAGPVQPPTTKKAAAAAAAAANKEAAQQAIRTLTPAEEARYGVQHHDRLAPGVQFRSDRAQKLTQAKSHVQTQKLASALAELEIPLRLVMPTERVVKDFEKLIHSVNLLLDARKVSEKVENEIRVLESAKEERARKAREAREKAKPEVKSEQQDDDDAPIPSAPDANNNKGDTSKADDIGGGQARPSTSSGPANGPEGDTTSGTDHKGVSHKRSASVLSNASDKSSKRQRK
ncbi:SANT/Myb-like DNA-binding domain-containing protein [Aspergillus lucknowensis]|uniref:SWR1-complex protein 4 n=1 Tax=Aspergillus lucknowensis TaxID=176173 RepID=A0ABR4LTR7_9EURO